jgi:hypothetical protein
MVTVEKAPVEAMLSSLTLGCDGFNPHVAVGQPLPQVLPFAAFLVKHFNELAVGSKNMLDLTDH